MPIWGSDPMLIDIHALDAHSNGRKICGPLPARVHFSVEPPRSVERDVRPFDWVSVASIFTAASKSFWFAGPMPRVSCCAMNSRKRPSLQGVRKRQHKRLLHIIKIQGCTQQSNTLAQFHTLAKE